MPTLGMSGLLGSIGVTGLIGLVVAALAAGVVLLLLRRRHVVDSDPDRPRTVADLVRLRAAAVSEPPLALAVASPVEILPSWIAPAPSEIAPVDAGSAGVEAVGVEAAEIEPAEDGPAERDRLDGDPVRESAGDPIVPEAAAAASLPAPEPDAAGDTPWARAARMAGDDIAQTPPAPTPPAPTPVADLTVDSDDDWSSWTDWAEVDGDEDNDHPAATPTSSALQFVPDPLPPVAVAALPDVAATPPAETPPAETAAEPESPSRARRSSTETAAEQAAADLALLRTFGFADPSLSPDHAPVVALVQTDMGAAPTDLLGPAQVVRFRALARDGSGVAGAGVALLDDRGRESSTATAGADGRGMLQAPRPGTYVVVSTAPDHQPGAVAITVSDETVDAEVLLARSAAVTGSVFGEDGPVAGARLTLVQDGEIVDAVVSASDGSYRIGDLAAGEYGLSVAAAGCEAVAVLVEVPDGADLAHDVELDPAGFPGQGGTGQGGTAQPGHRIDDMMIGQR